MPQAVDILRPRLPIPIALLVALLVAGCGDDAGGTGGNAGDGALRARYDAAVARVAAKRAEILPDASERRWEAIDFLPSYAAGLKAASEQGKPMLLWVMNGHPLGCT